MAGPKRVDVVGMDISSDPTGALRGASIQSAIGMRVAKMTLDAAKDQGQAAIALLQSAADVAQTGQSHAAHPGSLDVTA
jgi:hypothetical protein